MIRKSLHAVVFSTLFAGSLVYMGAAIAQQGPLEIVPLAQGFSSDRHVRLQGQGPSDDAANAVEGYATFILPAGSPPLQPAPEPQPHPCSQEPEH